MAKPDIGMMRARIAPTLTGEDLAELFALAEFCIGAGGSLSFNMGHTTGHYARFVQLGLAVAGRPKGMDLTPGTRLVSLTDLGWLTLLTRCEMEMAHLLPQPAEAQGHD